MKKPHNKRSYSAARAIELHAEANKSDPFAGARMSMTLRKGQDNATKVAHAAQRIVTARNAALKEAFKAWKGSEQRYHFMQQLFAA